METLLEDKKSSRRFFIAFLVIILIGGTIALFEKQEPADIPLMAEGSSSVLFINDTHYVMRLNSLLFSPLSNRPRMSVIVPPMGSKEYSHAEGNHILFGRKGAELNIRISRVSDKSRQVKMLFNGFEGQMRTNDVLIRRTWSDNRWTITFEEEQQSQ